MDVEDLILIRGFSKLAICKSRLIAHGAGSGKGSTDAQQNPSRHSPLLTAPSARKATPCFLRRRICCCRGEKRGGWRGWGTARCHPAHVCPADVVPWCQDLTRERRGPAALGCWCLSPGRREGGHGGGTQPGVLRAVPAPPARAWGGCTSGSVGLGQGGVG